ncbi:GPI ethanolamine phosphate transferase 2-like [Littorina saxatilis]|uniref:GPI ethanolamine phosphate transferase 2 C-terminal domain-containing protein n=1 Tax=Littorina saxatilis TaxID=31220 RepID=A0AAN9B8C1_9CAEN
MKVHSRSLLNIYCLAVTLFSYSLFLKCYFPVKQGLSGNTSPTDVTPEPVSGRNGVPKPSYSRLVLMVIDALRTDFVLGERNDMPFTQRLLYDGRGVSFAAKTHLPTVTLPRIKAITSGSIPGFVDVVLNFGSPALTDDNLVTQLVLAGKTLTFFGDDTWLNLFPDHFERADGTTSFYVADYTEVDNNVTRHLSKELSSEDWDVMILHYLGLDHIGHLYGPVSDLVPPKLHEMDAVVRQIYTAMKSWNSDPPSVLVICGDHGMSDQGGHGGASPGEINVPIIILSPHALFQQQKTRTRGLQQIDLCPTLSALMGLPMPKNNLGRVEVAALPESTPLVDKVRFLQLNAAQIAEILKENVDNIEEDQAYVLHQDALAVHASWMSLRNSSTAASWEAVGARVLMGYQDAVERMSHRISQTSTSYDMYGIVVAIGFLCMNLLIQSLAYINKEDPAIIHLTTGWVWVILLLMVAILSHVTLCTSQHSSDIMCSTSITSLAVQLAVFGILIINCVLGGLLGSLVVRNAFKGDRKPMTMLEVGLVGCTVFHSLSLLSSSFVEEEHQTWYFFSSSLHTLLLLHPLSILMTRLGQPRSTECAGASAENRTERTSDRFQVSSSDNNFTKIRSKIRNEEGDMSQVVNTPVERSKQMSAEECVKMVASLVGILFLIRILRRWNQTGNKWLDVPDVGDWLVRPENKSYLSVIVLLSLLCLWTTRLRTLPGIIGRLTFAGMLISTYLSKATSGALILPSIITDFVSSQGVLEARIAYFFIAGLLVCSLKYSPTNTTDNFPAPQKRTDNFYTDCIRSDSQSTISSKDQQDLSHPANQIVDRHKGLWEGVQVAWLSVMCLLLRPHNVVQVAMVSMVEMLTCHFVLPFVKLSPQCLVLYCLMMGQASFYFQGNSNSLSTVDVSAGLTALYDYQPVIIGLQMTMSTYAGVFFWLFTLCKYISVAAPSCHTQKWLSDTYSELCSLALLNRALPLAVYTILVTLMRYHLFVWTVFSPKLLYEGMLSLVVCGFCVLCLLMERSVNKISIV